VSTADRTARWKDIHGASLRVEDLASLADLRGRARMWVTVAEGRAWVWWQADSDVTPEVVARRIMPLEGAELFTRTGGQWYRLGERVPAFGVPLDAVAAGLSLDRIVVPAKITAERPVGNLPEPLVVCVVRCDSRQNHPATAMRSSIDELAAWADWATTSQLSCLRGAWLRASAGEAGTSEALVLGELGTLPLLPGSTRFWGVDLLVPLGFRVDPELPAPSIRHVFGAGQETLVMIDEKGHELIAREAFKPLTRTCIRLAREGARSGRAQGSPK
jgi:MoxR-vWA-beta-propeller ternary system domain bpX2